jgi:hypothetical protein
MTFLLLLSEQIIANLSVWQVSLDKKKLLQFGKKSLWFYSIILFTFLEVFVNKKLYKTYLNRPVVFSQTEKSFTLKQEVGLAQDFPFGINRVNRNYIWVNIYYILVSLVLAHILMAY